MQVIDRDATQALALELLDARDAEAFVLMLAGNDVDVGATMGEGRTRAEAFANARARGWSTAEIAGYGYHFEEWSVVEAYGYEGAVL